MGRTTEKSERASELSIEHMNTLLNSIHVQIWYVTDDHTYGMVNKAHADFNGCDIEDLVFKNMYDIFDEEVVDVWLEGNRKVFATGKIIHTEKWIPHVSGEQRLFSITKSPKLRDDGSVEYVVCSAQDITERKQGEQELRKLEERLYAVFDATESVPVQGYDVERRVMFWNKASEQLYGFSRDEALGKRLEDLIIPASMREDVIKGVDHWHATGEPIPNGEISLIDKNQAQVIVFSSHIMITNANGEKEMFCVDVDLTERKQAEKELQRMQKLDSLGTVAGGIAHDFNNLLTGIFGNLEMAKLNMPENTESLQYIGKAFAALQSARLLTSQLLTFAKGGAPILKTLATKKLVCETVGFNLHGSNIATDFNLPDDLWAIKADKGQIGQVLANITINAKQAMPGGGTLHVEGTNMERTELNGDAELAGQFVRLAIHDEGIGIPPKILDHIFDPYYTTKETGHGLGLSVVHSIITKHNGRIEVDSTPDVGTTFTFFLPALPCEEPESDGDTLDEDAYSQVTSLNILLMDDEEMIRDIGTSMMNHLGHNVDTATDGDETVEKYSAAQASGNPFHLVIMDLTIPGSKGGTDVIRDLQKVDPQVRVIVSSGYASSPVMANYADYGFAGKLAKPFALAELEREIFHVMGME